MLGNDPEAYRGRVRRIDHLGRLGDGRRHWLLDENVLPGASGRNRLIAMPIRRRGQHDEIDVAPCEQRLETGRQRHVVVGCELCGSTPTGDGGQVRAACVPLSDLAPGMSHEPRSKDADADRHQRILLPSRAGRMTGHGGSSS